MQGESPNPVPVYGRASYETRHLTRVLLRAYQGYVAKGSSEETVLAFLLQRFLSHALEGPHEIPTAFLLVYENRPRIKGGDLPPPNVQCAFPTS